MTQAPTFLRQGTIDRLQALIELNIDAAKGFQQASELIKNPGRSHIMRTTGETRNQFASELQALVSAGGQKPAKTGTTMGAIHRLWNSIRGARAPEDECAILAEVERSESVTKVAYEDALSENIGESVLQLLREHFHCIATSHDRVCQFRIHAKATQQATESARAEPTDGGHLSGVATGAVVGGITGAAAGAAAGPLGSAIGTATGAAVGAAIGRTMSKNAEPAPSIAGLFQDSPETDPEFAAADRFGWEARSRYPGQSFSAIEDSLRRDWEQGQAAADMTWFRAKKAVYDGWSRRTPNASLTQPGEQRASVRSES